MMIRTLSAAIAMTLLGNAGNALAQSAGTPCPKCIARTGGTQGLSIVPADQFGVYQVTDFARGQLNFGSGATQTIGLGFNFTLGSQVFNSVNVSRNGFVTFGSTSSGFRTAAAAAPSSLPALGNYVIAPFYANLSVPIGAAGGVYVQQGLADPFANGGRYSRADAQTATLITWSNLVTDSNAPATFQLILVGPTANSGNQRSALRTSGGSAFAFRYGTPDNPGLPSDADGIAGFVVEDRSAEYFGPFNPEANAPLAFEATPGALGLVPEPMTWVMLIAGFGLVGIAARRVRRSGARQPAVLN